METQVRPLPHYSFSPTRFAGRGRGWGLSASDKLNRVAQSQTLSCAVPTPIPSPMKDWGGVMRGVKASISP